MKAIRKVLLTLSSLLALNAAAQTEIRWSQSLGPTSVLMDTQAVIPFTTEVRYMVDGQWAGPAAGIPFRYSTVTRCGAFAEGSEMFGVTDENGIATSSAFFGRDADVGCKVSLDIQGGMGLSRTVYVFLPGSVVVSPERATIATTANQVFDVYTNSTADFQPVNAGPPELVGVDTSNSGATATLVGTLGCGINDGRCGFTFQGNGRAGTYGINFRQNGSVATVMIKQRPN